MSDKESLLNAAILNLRAKVLAARIKSKGGFISEENIRKLVLDYDDRSAFRQALLIANNKLEARSKSFWGRIWRSR